MEVVGITGVMQMVSKGLINFNSKTKLNFYLFLLIIVGADPERCEVWHQNCTRQEGNQKLTFVKQS